MNMIDKMPRTLETLNLLTFKPKILMHISLACAAGKVYSIVRLQGKGRLLAKFLRGRGGMGLVLGILAILITIMGLFLP
jgi:hypothetical protein